MKVLLTGGTGLIGREVGKLLVRQGHQVVTLSRDPEQARRLCPFPAQHLKWNGENPESVSEFKDVDGVIHLAGESVADGSWTDEKKKRILDSRVLPTRRLIEVLHSTRTKLQAFVSASAIGFYGDRASEELREDSSPGQGFLPEVCQAWEKALFETCPAFQTRRVAVRIGVVLSPSGGALGELLPLFQAGVGGALAGGDQWMSWIHLRDVARALVFALTESSAQGVLNAVAPEPCTNREFSRALGSLIRRPAILPTPGVALKLALGEKSIIALGSLKVSSLKLQTLGFRFDFLRVRDALADLLHGVEGSQEVFYTEQYVPISPDQIFSFFCDENNLERITPPFLNFHVLSKTTPTIERGTCIDYKLKLHGIPLKWRSVIAVWEPPHRFVDQQLKGPYSHWYHEHGFEKLGAGTLLTDRVTFRPPLGWLGQSAAGWYIRSDVEKIFDYRRRTIDELFAKNAASAFN